MLAAGKLRMSAGARTSTSYTLTSGSKAAPGIPTFDAGYYSSASYQYFASTPIAIGSISVGTFNGAALRGVYWSSWSALSDSYGQMIVEVAGDVGGDFVAILTVNGVSMGTISTTIYDAGTNNTIFYFTPHCANPLGTSGTRTIVIS